MAYKTVGNTLIEWDDSTPFVFSLREENGSEDTRKSASLTVDLSELRQGFTDDFLQHLREHLIERRNRVALKTIENESKTLRRLFRKVITCGWFDSKISVIDESVLLVFKAAREQMTEAELKQLRLAFNANPASALWAAGLQPSNFPQYSHKKGHYGRQIDRILAKALTRATCVHILSRCEQAYDLGNMDIGYFAFVNLAFAVFCRPESYRKIQLDDLVFDKKSNAYFIYILPAKTRVQHPQKLCYSINEPVGILLQKQRQSVVAQFGHLVNPQNIGKLALFPSRQLNTEKSAWRHAHANENFGMLGSSDSFVSTYPRQIQRAFQDTRITLSANALRHTVGTQLAQTGASAQTIQAVLKHSSDFVCRAYVDIAFQGLIDTLSDAMRPAFEMHLPAFECFRSKHDPINVQQAIRSDDLETGQIELIGECGKQIQCEHAPIACYGCTRFIPCWDADHSVNLSIVQREIDDGKRRGSPFQHMVEKAREAKYQIVLVMNAADRYQQELAPQVRP